MFTNPSDTQLRDFLLQMERIAVVGLSPKPHRPSFQVAHRMQDWGFEIIPVRPHADEILGEKAYARLEDIEDRVDLVNVFRAADEIDAVVTSAITIGAKGIWIQQGIVNTPAALRAQEAGLFTVMDRCLMVEYHRLGLA